MADLLELSLGCEFNNHHRVSGDNRFLSLINRVRAYWWGGTRSPPTSLTLYLRLKQADRLWISACCRATRVGRPGREGGTRPGTARDTWRGAGAEADDARV
jgi:hypothetical protein